MENKETLEEAALSFLPISEIEHDSDFIIGFEVGAKWQAERMYTEEEVLELVSKRSFDLKYKKDSKSTKEWFNEFKKK